MPLLWKFRLHHYLISQWTRAQLAINRDFTHPMKEDVKGKILPSPLGGDVSVVTYIQPRLILGRVIGLAALARRRF